MTSSLLRSDLRAVEEQLEAVGAERNELREQLSITEARIAELESAHHSTWKARHDVLWRALERGREHVRRGRTLFTPAPDGTRADFELGLSILLDQLETALAVPTDG